jgi:hypothetical protein
MTERIQLFALRSRKFLLQLHFPTSRNRMKKTVCLLLAALCWSCTHDSGTEKYQNKRNNAVNVREKLKEIIIEDVLINSFNVLYLIDDWMMKYSLPIWNLTDSWNRIMVKMKPVIQEMKATSCEGEPASYKACFLNIPSRTFNHSTIITF